MLDKSICHFRGVGSILSPSFFFCWKILLANNVDPDQMPHYVSSALGLHRLPMTLLQVSGKNGLSYIIMVHCSVSYNMQQFLV